MCLFLKEKIDKLFRHIVVKKNPHFSITKSNFSIIASNCNGAVFLHDIHQKFNSPFVNLWIKPADFIKLLTELKYYMSLPLEFVKEEGIHYPIGVLKDIKIYFEHYKNEKEALEKWNSRVARINYNDIYIFFTDRDGCTYNDLLMFDELDFKHKVVFTHVEYPNIKSSFYIKGFENDQEVGVLSSFVKNKIGHRHYDVFDFKGFIES